MENVMMNGFVELDEQEMNCVDGGSLLVGTIVGCCVAWAIDGVVEYGTGKSVGGWIATGLHALFD